MTKILELEDVKFSYDGKKTKSDDKKEVLKGLSFSIEDSRRIALLGPNGSGKSTTFKIISTQLKNWSGSVRVSGTDLRAQPLEVRKKLGVCFQSPSLDKILTARENLILQGKILGVDKASLDREIEDLTSTLKVDYLDKRVSDLSGGQARRIEIMKAFLGKPSLLLLDEPTNGLDPQVRRDFWRELDEISTKKNCTVLVTTHIIEEAEVCDELVFISEGLCVAQGEPRKLRASLGYEIIKLEIPMPEQKSLEIKKELVGNESVEIVGDALRISTNRALELFEKLRSRWSSEIQSIEWAKPTLADVYFEKTGKAFV